MSTSELMRQELGSAFITGVPADTFRTRPAMRHPEHQYLDLLEQVLARGDERIDRTGVGTRSIFGAMLRFDLSDGQVPILTTKRVYWKTAVKEMRWGDLGPVYGKQWRRWLGADGREHDQIATLVDTLRTNPASRRMLFHGWNVAELGGMALPPCHMVYQYHVTSDGRLNCLMFQRSVDLLLGAAFNFVGATALQLMLAQQAGLRPGELVWVAGDAHLYLNHLDQAREQIARTPRPFPTMHLARRADSIDGYRIGDFTVEGYDPHAAIKADVAV